jgi:hypothetical protein
VLALAAWDASAQDLEPRVYANTPPGINFVLGGYASRLHRRTHYLERRGNGRSAIERPRGGTLTLPVDRHNSIKLFDSTGVYSRTWSDFSALGIAWQFRWGAGL